MSIPIPSTLGPNTRTAAARSPTIFASLLLALALIGALVLPSSPDATAQAAPTFDAVFTPNSIGPGGTSTLTFTISNTGGTPVTGLSFTNTLPTAITIASSANATSDCVGGRGGSLDAPDGGGTITLTDGSVGGSSSCTVSVDVTSSTIGTHTNPAVTLNSSAGSTMSLAVDLTVASDLPGFTKAFSPSSVSRGATSTLTFTFDNTDNALNITVLELTDNLPTGMEIADPANASTDCRGALVDTTTLTVEPGTTTIGLATSRTAPDVVLAAGGVCTLTVDVLATGTGSLDNLTEPLLVRTSASATLKDAGTAAATLEVTTTPLAISKSFTDDPVAPGGFVTLDFTIENLARGSDATDVAFTDDLATLVPSLAGLTFDSLIDNTCGGAVTGQGTTTITFTGGTVASGAPCMIGTSLAVPADAAPGTYTNTSSAVTGSVDGRPLVGNTATANLFVAAVPTFTKEFLEVGTLAPNPIAQPGDDVVLRFTITGTSQTSTTTDISFVDELTDSSGNGSSNGLGLPFPVSVTLPPVPNPPCGPGSNLSLISLGTDRQGLLLSNGSLAAAPGADATCTFDVTISLPGDLPPGTYSNTTEPLTATVDGASVIGPSATGDLPVVAAPQLSKSFTDDPVAPGATVTLEFTLTKREGSPATDVAFTDDLDAVVSGLAATGLPQADVCGPGSQVSGTTTLTLTGGSLAAGGSCTFSVTVQVPAGAAAGTFTNTTSDVSATVDGLTVRSRPATDDLTVNPLVFTKEFLDDPVVAGGTTTLRFTIANRHPTYSMSNFYFEDNLGAVLPGLVATGLPSSVCGGSITGTTVATFTGGLLAARESCVIDVELQLPANAADGTYRNVVSILGRIDGSAVVGDTASDDLVVDSARLQLVKTFTDDPVPPGGTVSLQFELTNLDPARSVASIAFTDDLGAALSGLAALGTPISACGGTLSGTTSLAFSGGSLPAGGSCTFSVTLQVPAGAADGTYTNTTSAASGLIDGLPVSGVAATDELVVRDGLVFTKSFDGPTVAGSTVALTFTITNPTTDSFDRLGFTDDLSAVIPGLVATSLPSSPCGGRSSITGTSVLTFIGGEVAPSSSCSFDVDVVVATSATAGTFTNTTSELSASGVTAADPATADLVIEPPPTFAKTFAPDAIFQNTSSTLTFTIDNSASALDATDLDFTDNLPAGVTVATPPSASTTCTGGTVTAAAGSSTISYTGGTVGAGSSCTVDVDVTATTVGAHVNTTGELTSSSGSSGTATDTLTATASADLSVTKTDSADPALAGDRLTYTITVDNAGPSDATNVVATESLPAGLTFVSSTGCAEDPSGVPTCSLGTIAAGDSVQYTVTVDIDSDLTATLQNTVSVTSDADDPNAANDTAVETTAVETSADLSITKTDSVDPVRPGASITYTITVENAGPSDATNVVATESLPAGLTFVSSTGCAEDPSGVPTCSLGTIAAGDSVQYTVTVDIDSDAAGTLLNTASVASDTTDPAPANDTVGETTTVATVADLSITKTDSIDPVMAGDQLTYTVTVANAGPSAAANVVVTDTLRAGLTLVSSSGCAEDPTGVPTCSLGTIAAGESARYTVTVMVDADLAPGTLSNTATVTSDAADENPENDTVTETTAVETSADLSITKTADADTALAGATLTYTVTVTNAGPSDATDVAVTESLPAGVTFVSSTGCAEDPDAAPTCSLGTIAAGASRQYTVTVLVDGDATGTLNNTVSVTSAVGDPATANNVASASTPVTRETVTPVPTPTPDRPPVVIGERPTVDGDALTGSGPAGSGPADGTAAGSGAAAGADDSPHTSPVPATDTSAAGGLAHTGSSSTSAAQLGFLLLVAGTGFALAARRRRQP